MVVYRTVFLWLCLGTMPALSADLLSIYRDALSGDPRIKLANIQVGIGAALEKQAIGNLLPQISSISSFTQSRQDLEKDDGVGIVGGTESFSGERYSVALTQPIINFSRYHQWRGRKELAGQYEADRVDTYQKLMLDVIERYFNVLQAEDDLNVVAYEITATARLLEQLEQLYSKRLARITEVLEVQARLDRLNADEVGLKTSVLVARDELQELTGEQVGELTPLRESIDVENIDTPYNKWLEIVREKNPTLQSLRKAVEVQRQSLKEQRAIRYPVVDLQISHQKSDIGFENSPRPTTTTQVIGVTVNLPIFTSGVNSARISEAVQRYEKARLEYELELRRLDKTAKEALLKTNASTRRIVASLKAKESAEKSFQAMEEGFKYGTVTSADVLDAQRNESQTQRDVNISKYDYVRNRALLLMISGMISVQELEVFNQQFLAK